MSNLRIGSRGAAVADLQRSLGVTIDGRFGPETAAAVRGFQLSQGLVVDGIVGRHTMGRLMGVSKLPDPISIPTSTLQRGMRGPGVATLQRSLGITADGIFGRQTEAAVRRFQSRHGLDADGIFGKQTRTRIFGSKVLWTSPLSSQTMLQRGMKGPDVAELQRHLGIKADGIFGPKTAAATRAFQQKHGLMVDGIFGPKTRSVLLNTPMNRPIRPLSTPTRSSGRGASVASATELQRILNVRERGNYGLLTKAAVRGFQTGAKLPVTGALEPRTWQLVRAAEAARKDYLASTGIPASISKVRSVTYQASEIINRIYLEDWVANINEARREYFKSGGHTAKPLAPREVEKILSEAGKLKIVENEAEWKRVMKGDMTSLGGVVVDKETRRMKEIVINPYIKNGTTWSAPLHEVEHVIKEYAGVPGQALVKGGTDFYKDTVHHRTTRDSETRTLYRMYPAPERPWYERLVRYISGRGK